MDHQDKTPEKLFTEFPAITTEEWKNKIIKDLKGADYNKKLVWRTTEGFQVDPFYRKEDLDKLDHLDVLPGNFPFVRGEKTSDNNWNIRQDIKVEELSEANKKALDVLMKGITSLGFILPETKPDEKDIEDLLENVFADLVELNFKTDGYSIQLLEIIDKLAKKYNRDLDKICGSVDYDPLKRLLLNGDFPGTEKEAFDHAVRLIQKAAHLPNMKVITVNGDVYKNSGASIVEELAFTLAHANEYLAQLTDRGMSINKIAPRFRFNLAVGSNYFMEIAKLRAARILWAHITNAYGPEHTDITRMNIHTFSSDWNKTLYDPHVNMLRTTTEAMSAIIGGTDSLTLKGFNEAYQSTDEFSERIARNQQLLLKEESYLDKVIDPAGGSYYIENLTNSIANDAWKLFLEIDEQGGFVESLKAGMIQARINNSANQKDMDIATRRISILGTNQFPAVDEKIDKGLENSFFEKDKQTDENAMIETLKPYRGAQAFEKLRYQTDVYARTNKRPSVFMLTYGNLAMRRARAQFSGNFFACAGYEIIDNNGFPSAEEGVHAAIERKADIIVLCSSDDEYAELAPAVSELVRGKALVVVAGYPKDHIDDLKAKGIQNFIHIRSNVLETLNEFQSLLGIE